MRLEVVAGLLLGALFGTCGLQAQSGTAQDAALACTTDAVCVKSSNSDPSANDLTPTQWLFGRDAFSKLAQPPMSAMDAANRATWKSAFEVTDGSLKTKNADSKAVGRHTPSAPDATMTAAPLSPDSAIAMQRLLVQEWIRTELGVADSVYHEHLQRLANRFDSAQRATLSDTARRSVMLRIDALLAGDNYTWIKFREDIVRRADSALSSLVRVPGTK